uniref:VWFA domain-containing protein n=2 Tax=Ciona intestinalis TaxID=7719 RepID=H2XPP8_CIOIN
MLKAENGNRPDVQDLVVLITDGRAQDRVDLVSADLRATGAVVFVVAVILPGSTIRLSQMLEISGTNETLLIVDSGFDGLDTAFSSMLTKYFCPTDLCLNI